MVIQNGPSSASSTSFVNTMGADFNILVTNRKTYLVSILETKREPNVKFVNRISFVDITGGVAKKGHYPHRCKQDTPSISVRP